MQRPAMSIAVSVVVGPSLIHRLLLAGCGLAQFAAALAAGILAPERFPSATFPALALGLASAVLLASAARRPKTHRIDISGTGDLRVTVQQDMGAADSVVSLLPGSVVWTVLIVLRYGAPGMPARVLPVWRDSVDAQAWRALAVALAVSGRRADGVDECSKIR
jgi:toxin CptA